MVIIKILVKNLVSEFNLLYDQQNPNKDQVIKRQTMFNIEKHAWPIAKNADIISQGVSLRGFLGSEALDGMFDCILRCIFNWQQSDEYKIHQADIVKLAKLRVTSATKKVENKQLKRTAQVAGLGGQVQINTSTNQNTDLQNTTTDALRPLKRTLPPTPLTPDNFGPNLYNPNTGPASINQITPDSFQPLNTHPLDESTIASQLPQYEPITPDSFQLPNTGPLHRGPIAAESFGSSQYNPTLDDQNTSLSNPLIVYQFHRSSSPLSFLANQSLDQQLLMNSYYEESTSLEEPIANSFHDHASINHPIQAQIDSTLDSIHPNQDSTVNSLQYSFEDVDSISNWSNTRLNVFQTDQQNQHSFSNPIQHSPSLNRSSSHQRTTSYLNVSNESQIDFPQANPDAIVQTNLTGFPNQTSVIQTHGQLEPDLELHWKRFG
ncbi:uncharacterized protein MELLADRAFT_105027 [Melampsora larici-populina 98AG31]|uniref:Uncharacterized protein n=1 Tax=Melampsora larici-populina (strain 98AG31 / pathotype 3-4-7) TaxID=747676 RepID=F4RGP8_MELLP|nr:uncharacterized protein MELLADRAFT_105027 [Melampsora larici-populina 98AG31]EGG08570.1 hypothetical protein MELLADRAFT_105027 [Melampsora larici-populina 98AG31]